ncbi:MAG: hypothetical protein WB792_05020 [Desulfobacterales bacterium]
MEISCRLDKYRSGKVFKKSRSASSREFNLLCTSYYLVLTGTQKNNFKSVRLVEQHNDFIKVLKSEYPGHPNMSFFRHVSGVKVVKSDQAFGNKLFYKYWIKACKQLGIEGVDLYAGTRHTTTTEIARRYGSEYAMKASDHQTNRAFKRYCQHQDDIAFEMAVAAKKSKQELNNVIKLTG